MPQAVRKPVLHHGGEEKERGACSDLPMSSLYRMKLEAGGNKRKTCSLPATWWLIRKLQKKFSVSKGREAK